MRTVIIVEDGSVWRIGTLEDGVEYSIVSQFGQFIIYEVPIYLTPFRILD